MTEKFDELIKYVQAEGRVCPQPMEWHNLWKSLPGCPARPGQHEPWPPFILSGWWGKDDQEKADRFHYHIRWAFENGEGLLVDQFLRGLPRDKWHYRIDPS